MSGSAAKLRTIIPRSIPSVHLGGSATLPTTFGEFRIHGFVDTTTGEEYAVLSRGALQGAEQLPVRLHSQCFTGDVMHSLRCDCREQLEAAMQYVAASEAGAVVYLPQEGRGIGLVNKIRAYALQERGLDTVEANLALGFESDTRSYDGAAAILGHLGVASVRLLTNNPDKVAGLQACGVQVSGRIPLLIEPNPHNERYLSTKRERCGHMD